MIEAAIRQNLKILVLAYMRGTGGSMAKASKTFYGNGGFFEDFFAGRTTLSVKKLSEMIEEIQEKWPEGEPWPICPVIAFHRHPPGREGRIIPTRKARRLVTPIRIN